MRQRGMLIGLRSRLKVIQDTKNEHAGANLPVTDSPIKEIFELNDEEMCMQHSLNKKEKKNIAMEIVLMRE